jgi:hypothetical protein
VTSAAIPGSDPVAVGSSRFRDLARWTFITLAVALLPLMVAASFDFGVTWDEKDRHRNGENVWMFLRGLRPRSAFAETGGHLYPGFFDTICAAVEMWVPLDRYVLRHTINAVFGWIGVVYCGRLAGRLFGPWAAVLGMVLLAASPRYFADSMNNPKDLPFAAMTIATLYYISTVSPKWPFIRLSTGVKILLALALAMGIRIGAVVYLGYLGLLSAALVLFERVTDWRRLLGLAARLVAIAVAMLILGTVFWPWAGGSPLTRPFQALLGAANYPWNAMVLFNGHEYQAAELPWYYAPWWVLISTPPVVLLGAALSVRSFTSRADAWRRAGLWFVVLFPMVTTVVMGSTLYDGIRHLLFIYPVLVVLAVGGWTGLLRSTRPSWVRAGAAACVAVGLMSMLTFDIRFHPNQGVYFNSLVGGPRSAFARYDMDYWGNCVLQAVEWTVETARSSGAAVTISGHPTHLVQLDSERFSEVAFTPLSRNRHYFQIRLARGPVEALQEMAREPALHQVRTPDGAVLCTVTPGPAFDEWVALRGPGRIIR